MIGTAGKTFIGACSTCDRVTRITLVCSGATVVVPCATCNNDPAWQARREAFLTEHPRGWFEANVKVGSIRGRASKKECGDECRTARGTNCACACVGSNHGADA